MDNNNQSNKDNDTRKIFTTLVLVLTLMIFTTGATYAFFAINAENNNVATGTAANASLTLTVTEETLGGTSSGNVKTDVMVPQLSNYLSTAMGANYKCVDANGNTVCKVYTISVTNGSTAAVRLNGTIQFLAPASETAADNKYTNLYWRKVEGATTFGTSGTNVQVQNTNNTAITSNTTAIDCSTPGTYCSKIYDISSGNVCTVSPNSEGCTRVALAKNGSITYNIVVWINETNSDQNDTDKGIWKAIIKFEGENGKGVTSTITS